MGGGFTVGESGGGKEDRPSLSVYSVHYRYCDRPGRCVVLFQVGQGYGSRLLTEAPPNHHLLEKKSDL